MVPLMKVEKLSQYFENALENSGFFYPEDKAESMKANFRNMWSRMPLTNSDVQLFYGMLKQLLRTRRKLETAKKLRQHQKLSKDFRSLEPL